MRIKILRVIVVISFLVVLLDLLYVQVLRGPYYFRLSKHNRIRVVPLEGRRGRIFDRSGNVLADNRLAYNVMVTPQEIKDQEELFSFLSAVLKKDAEEIKKIFQQKKTAPFAPVVIAEDIGDEQIFTLEENKYRFPSLLIQQSFKRFYPLRENSAHVLGYVGRINRSKIQQIKEYGYSPQSLVGYSGVEEYYDSYLRGVEGGIQIEVDNKGRQVRLLGLKEASQGEDVSLTIDSRIQRWAMDGLGGRDGVVIVMNSETGEIMALTSSPVYDPNVFLEKNSGGKVGLLFSNRHAPLLNRAIKGQYPPGSVFKVPVAIAALDTKKIKTGTSFVCQGSYEVGGTSFRCPHPHGLQNFYEAVAHSCNVYFFHLGLMLGVDTIERYTGIFGLGQLTHIDLPYEERGHVPGRRERSAVQRRGWYTGDTLNFVIGQGETLVTPIQLVRMMATVARDGKEVQPHVIKSIGQRDVKRYPLEREMLLDKNVFQEVKKGLRAAVTNDSGTARVLDIAGLHVAGKTGTAQTSGGQADHAWFVGYVQGEKNLAICIFLEHGGSSYNACLLARELLLKMREEKVL